MTMIKHVQTTLEPHEIKELEEVCEREGIPKREAMREAIIEWVTRKKGFNPEDPLFTLKPGSADVKKGSLKVDEVVYSREGAKR